MQVRLVVLQDPDNGSGPQLREAASVLATEVRKGYLILAEVPDRDVVKFNDYLDGFLSSKLHSCHRDHNLIFTSHSMSFDPVEKIVNWARDWLKVPVAARPI